MLPIYNKIIKEIIREKSKNPKVKSILLYGSLARGTSNKESDVDIEISHSGNKYKDIHEYRYGIKVDYEYWPERKLAKRIAKYPFLSYPYLEEKILYDPTGVAKKNKKQLKSYFNKNPKVKKEWNKWTKEYLEFKKKKIKRTNREKIKSCKEFYDKLEIKFSNNHKITRDF